jgi:hypothetical protein
VQSINVTPGVPNTARNVVLAFKDQSTADAQPNFLISGITKDATGAPLGNCDVHLFRTSDDLEVGQTVSDPTGAFAFYVAPGVQFYCVAYKAGSPDVSGTTLNTVTGA